MKRISLSFAPAELDMIIAAIDTRLTLLSDLRKTADESGSETLLNSISSRMRDYYELKGKIDAEVLMNK